MNDIRQRIGSVMQAIPFVVLLIVGVREALAQIPFTSTFEWNERYRIYGHEPIPQVDGFDYYISPQIVDASLRGMLVEIETIEVRAFGYNVGEVVNFNVEVHLSDVRSDWAAGQYIETHIDPVSGYERDAPAQFRFGIGSRADNADYEFSGSYDFRTGEGTAHPYVAVISAAFTRPLDLPRGLRAQVFFWTADNRNCQIEFKPVSVRVTGKIIEGHPTQRSHSFSADGDPPQPEPDLEINVPATGDLMLAGQPAGTCVGSDCVPQHLPTFVPLDLGSAPLVFLADGITTECCTPSGPDGDGDRILTMEGIGGFSAIAGPISSCIGVFVSDEIPPSPPAPPSLDFSESGIGVDFDELSPQIGQVFFIGDGSTSDGNRQIFHVPEGSTGLFLGVLDMIGTCRDNTGSLCVGIWTL